MRLKTMLQSAAVIGLAVVAGLLGVGGTWALWNTAATADPGTVRAANFKVLINNQAMKPGVAASAVAQGQLTPTSQVHATVKVTNTTDAGGPFRIKATIPALLTQDDTLLATKVKVETVPMTGSASCDLAFDTAPEPTSESTPVAVVIGKNKSESFCVRISLPHDAPTNHKPEQITVDIPVAVEQVR